MGDKPGLSPFWCLGYVERFARERLMPGTAISTREFAMLFIAGFVPWYILVLGILYYMFLRYLKYLDAKEAARCEQSASPV